MRRGISLLEVLISMFVLLVGVISVFSLLALGRFEMLEGSKADRAMSVARSAQSELLGRGFLRPLQTDFNTNQMLPMWLDTTSTNVWGPANAGTLIATAAAPEWPAGTPAALPFDAPPVAPANWVQLTSACAIDPLGMAANSTTANPPVANATVTTVLPFFPAYLGNAANTAAMAMKRITLRSTGLFTGSPIMKFYAMSSAQADSIFRSQDDLVLLPPNGNYPPVQEFALTTLSTGTPSRRQSTGDYSWLATVAPTQGDTRMCTVSIVVFYKRNLLLPGAVPVATIAPPERMVSIISGSIAASVAVPSATGTALGGGEAVLSCSIALTADYIKVRPNQWILLSQTPALPGWWRWYRVAATSDPIRGTDASGNPAWLRPVSLAGPDWNTSLTTNASVFDDVIGVYERNMQLEESGALWSQN